ncbi:MAG: metallophosphoesterase [Nocardioidaceae bacterium]
MTRRRLAVFGLVIAIVAAVSLAIFSPPAFVTSLFADDLPAETAGDAVPPIAGTPAVRIAVAGDTGTGNDAEDATAERMLVESQKDPYDALLLLGDLIYDDGDAALVDSAVTEPFAPILDGGAKLVPVLGNHDYKSGEQEQILTALGRQDSWYVEQIGSVRIIVLDSNQVEDTVQTQWLRDTLAEPEPPETWTVAAMHHPAYSAGYHGSDRKVQETWAPLFAEYGVPLVLAGHDHDYQRSIPQEGVTYVVSGAGAKTRPVGQEDFTAVSTSTLHYLDLLFYDDRVVGRAIDQGGRLVDTFTISR